MKQRNKFIYSLCAEARLTLYALSAFLLLLFFGTWFTEHDKAQLMPVKPNTMYVWHNGKSNGLVRVADICGTGNEIDNGFIHVRQEKNKAAEVILWLYGKNFEPSNHYNVSVRFDSITLNRKCRFVINNDGMGVLYINRPKNVLKQMTENETFDVILKQHHKIIDIFHFNSPRLKW